jgi:hypothetical protein
MRDSLFWRFVTVAAIAIGLYIGHGLHVSSDVPMPDPFFATSVYAGGVSAMTEDTDYVVTTSEDERMAFVWELNGSRAPQYHAQAIAKRLREDAHRLD